MRRMSVLLVAVVAFGLAVGSCEGLPSDSCGLVCSGIEDVWLECGEGSTHCEYEYDEHNRVIRWECEYLNDVGFTCEYTYDGDGARSLLACEGEGDTCEYVPDWED